VSTAIAMNFQFDVRLNSCQPNISRRRCFNPICLRFLIENWSHQEGYIREAISWIVFFSYKLYDLTIILCSVFVLRLVFLI
jgi:hypothetical protein